jgi:hypothetical protein
MYYINKKTKKEIKMSEKIKVYNYKGELFISIGKGLLPLKKEPSKEGIEMIIEGFKLLNIEITHENKIEEIDDKTFLCL